MVDSYKKIISDIKDEGLYKAERTITSSQNIEISTEQDSHVLNSVSYTHLTLPTKA